MIGLYQKIKAELKVLRLLLFTIATSFYSHAQEPNESVLDALLDDLFFNEQQFLEESLEGDLSYDFLYTSVSYNSNTYFSGREGGADQFNIIPQVSYYHSSGFNLGVSGIYYQEFLPNWDFTSLSLGYFNTLGTKKTGIYTIGYTKYLFADGYEGFTNSFDISLGIRNKKRTFGTTISASYLFGGDESYQIIANSYVNFTLKRTLNFALRLRPAINFVAAKQTLTLEKNVLFNNQRVLKSISFEVFDLLNTQISLPLSISTNSWDFELGYTLNIPKAVLQEAKLETTSFFSFSVGYLFNLSR
jgi:hypothetical protein